MVALFTPLVADFSYYVSRVIHLMDYVQHFDILGFASNIKKTYILLSETLV